MPDEILTRDFYIHISQNQGIHKIVKFSVPISHLEGTVDYLSIIDRAGWWYMNKIDLFSCTGTYEWSVFPADLIEQTFSVNVIIRECNTAGVTVKSAVSTSSVCVTVKDKTYWIAHQSSSPVYIIFDHVAGNQTTCKNIDELKSWLLAV